MALIQCPECGKEVSDQSEKCLNCGFPIKKAEKPAESANRKSKTDRSKAVILLNAGLGFFALLFFIGVVSSKGGISGNQNAAIVAWGILAGSILCLFSQRDVLAGRQPDIQVNVDATRMSQEIGRASCRERVSSPV